MIGGAAILIESIGSGSIPGVMGELQRNQSLGRTFPMIKTERFQSAIQAVSKITEAGDEKGLILEITPHTAFRKYGTKEVALVIYPEYQRQGIGTQVMSLLRENRKPTFFVSSKSNPVSTSFFKKQPSLALLDETDRCRVYSRR
jgi:GNAT superfamily N-acetyltransferase